jgi:hypothetical protein
MTNPTVQPGQTWADNDPRSTGRTLRILAVTETHAIAEVLTGRGARDNRAAGRTTRIRLDRMRPTANGYRLVTDAEG